MCSIPEEPPRRPLIVGHRGSPDRETENTMAAVEAALAAGADAVEVDVRETRDGVLVCLHDPDMHRLTGCSDLVSSLDFGALRELFPALLTLDEVLALSHRGGIVVDPKGEGAIFDRRLAALCATAPLPDCVLIAAGSAAGARALRELNVRRVGAFFADDVTVDQAQLLRVDWVRLRPTQNDARLVAGFRAAGIGTFVVAGMDGPDQGRAASLELLQDWHRVRYDGLILDNPGLASDFFRQASEPDSLASRRSAP